MAGACLFLASKICEQQVILRDFCPAYYEMSSRRKQANNPNLSIQLSTAELLSHLKLTVSAYEYQLMKCLEFKFGVEMPYRDINLYRETMNYQLKIQFTVVSYNFASDSFRTRAYLVVKGKDVAKTCIYLACRYLNLEVNVQPDDLSLDLMLNLYDEYINKQ